ncbi:hypothetical protein GCM10009547_49330 [Sporichthya brevicatena]|uniref:Uncharacterized protein n=1 Tax=Sporichthya brevicatena TaxID=171442 RepID=A0ABN1HDQ0_9ACTN
MHNTSSGGRHRKPNRTRAIALRTAVSAGAAAVAVLATPAAASASTPGASPPVPCTGSPLDGFTTCGASGYYGNGVTGSNAGDFAGDDTPGGK